MTLTNNSLISISEIEEITELDLRDTFVLPKKYVKETYTIMEYLSLASILVDRSYFEEVVKMSKKLDKIDDLFIDQYRSDLYTKLEKHTEDACDICHNTIEYFISELVPGATIIEDVNDIIKCGIQPHYILDVNGERFVCHVSKYIDQINVGYLKLYMDTYKMKGLAMGSELTDATFFANMTFVEVSDKLQLRYRREVSNQINYEH